jgi:AraC family transcriptional regulator of adaptative response/methylated-DNA-[protein]-cysteine methyltransferase
MIAMNVIAESIDYLVAHHTAQPDLDSIARRAGYEPTYFQKIFKDHVGISPKRLIQFMTVRYARELLNSGHSTLETSYAAGLSGNGRLHDLFVAVEAVTPGDIQHKGKNLTITFGLYPSILGNIVIAKTTKGICWLGFLVQESELHCFERIVNHWPRANVIRDDQAIIPEAKALLSIWNGQHDPSKKLKLDLYGSNFQIQVWQALLKIPYGQMLSYQEIADQVGRPKASRAVGNAVGANPVSLLIPCHRVIRATGIIDNYSWGSSRKKLILGLEAAR